MHTTEEDGPVLRRSLEVGGIVRRLVWSIPLGGQLSALYTLLLVVTLTLVGALVYTQQETFLVQDATSRLVQAATHIVALPDAHPAGDTEGPGTNPASGHPSTPDDSGTGQNPADDSPTSAQSHLLENLVRGLSGPGITVAILDSQGQAITTTQGLAGDTAPVVAPVTAQQATSLQTSAQPLQWVVTRDGTRYVVVLMAIAWHAPDTAQAATGGATTLLVEQSASLAAADAALARLGTVLLLGVLAGTLAGVVLGLLFTRAVLRPLEQVTTTAEAIAGGDLQRRLQLPAGRSEVARLGHSFDDMVGRLVATLEAQRRFVADASHELRTPLTSLKGLAEILMIGAHGNDPKIIEQSAHAMNDELTRLNRLVNDLLTLSRLDSSGPLAPPARRTRLDLCATVQGAAAQMAALAQGRDIGLTQACAGPAWIMGDAGQLRQVLLNLLDNALRYTPAGGTVTVRGTADGGMARIEVRDTGSGISPGDLPHIFERFYRGDASRTRATGNSGLGLAIAQAIIAAQGGQITVQSTLGSGTCFTIALPLAPGAAPTEEAAPRVLALR